MTSLGRFYPPFDLGNGTRSHVAGDVVVECGAEFLFAMVFGRFLGDVPDIGARDAEFDDLAAGVLAQLDLNGPDLPPAAGPFLQASRSARAVSVTKPRFQRRLTAPIVMLVILLSWSLARRSRSAMPME